MWGQRAGGALLRSKRMKRKETPSILSSARMAVWLAKDKTALLIRQLKKKKNART